MIRFICVIWLAFSSQAMSQDDIVVFAAASLKTALDQVVQDWPDNNVVISYGSSSAMARQISLGAPAQIFISANPEWMDYLQEKEMIDVGSRRDLLGNSLVLIAPTPAEPLSTLNGAELRERLGQGRFIIPITNAVPAGQYGRASLEALGIWHDVKDQLAETENVRTALALVARGAVPVGLVYATDANAEPRVDVIARLPPDSHPPIRYPVALTIKATPSARGFFDFLSSPLAQQHFADQGFILLP
ncbi:molybdate ABC transporter substrate-binding protein [Parasulfitobacter algicola]|uniref:Molybdate ABC transporter substrate-binding protein n=1 Tax=Parasulfitobacter algicola TaxID=2614809 RepID=A0ABX2ITV9_9RHOB|nr:molybdate ABC transporter substrate-binding protein [Sulfitobacter algicola]NSX56343.1 molybdate ABC transporter substrate-binding protein [Sulfitobacter algicola]